MAEGGGVNTTFGTVTDKRVIYFTRKGWLAGGTREDIPLRHVTSIRLEISRHIIGGSFLLLMGLLFMASPGAAKVLALIPLALGTLLLWGSPKVVLNTAGGDLRPERGLPWTRPEADKFVMAVRAQLFKED
jgi:hypothetical protein